jgi:hypothetical protein
MKNMRYSTPYSDKITLPHIKKISSIGINTDNLFYDSRELSGEVIIDGEYLTENELDIMSFTHDLPVSILIDDEEVEPEVHISNFKYELIPGVGLEIMFELDMILTDKTQVDIKHEEVLNQRIEELDKQLAENKQNLENLNNSSEIVEAKRGEVIEPDQDAVKFKNQMDKQLTEKKQNLENLINSSEIVEAKRCEVIEPDQDAVEFKNQIDKNLEKIIGDRTAQEVPEVVEETEVKRDEEDKIALLSVLEDEIIEEEAEEIEVLDNLEIVKAEVDKLSTKLQATSSSFDTGFISSNKDRFTTYKIILLEENENIDEVLERKNLSRALICDEYKSDSSKVILKIENDGN